MKKVCYRATKSLVPTSQEIHLKVQTLAFSVHSAVILWATHVPAHRVLTEDKHILQYKEDQCSFSAIQEGLFTNKIPQKH